MFETGDVILCRSNGILSGAVSWITRSPYSHVAIIYEGSVAIHSTIGGVRSVSVWNLNPFDVYRLKSEMTEWEKDKVKITLDNSLRYDIAYDYYQFFAYSYYSIFGGENKFNSPNKYICSELIDVVFKRLGYHLTKYDMIGDVTPKEIAKSKLLIKKEEYK